MKTLICVFVLLMMIVSCAGCSRRSASLSKRNDLVVVLLDTNSSFHFLKSGINLLIPTSGTTDSTLLEQLPANSVLVVIPIEKDETFIAPLVNEKLKFQLFHAADKAKALKNIEYAVGGVTSNPNQTSSDYLGGFAAASSVVTEQQYTSYRKTLIIISDLDHPSIVSKKEDVDFSNTAIYGLYVTKFPPDSGHVTFEKWCLFFAKCHAKSITLEPPVASGGFQLSD